MAADRRRQICALQTLWSQQHRGLGAEARPLRLRWLSEISGRDITSANDLHTRELDRALHLLRCGGDLARCSTRQEHLIRKLEAALGWHTCPERLAGFLLARYQTEQTTNLSAAHASGCIQALKAMLSRAGA